MNNAGIRVVWAVGFLILGLVGCASPQARGPEVYDIPQLAGVQIDGQATDWKDQGFRVDAMGDMSGKVRPEPDFDAAFLLGWDQRGLLLLASVADDQAVEAEKDIDLWQKDSVELFLAPAVGSADVLQVLIAPGTDPNHAELRYAFDDRRKDEALRKIKPSFQAARRKVPGGYVLEALLPWANLAIAPRLGREIAFQIYINDVDGGPRQRCVWYPADHTNDNTNQMHRLRLAQRPAPPVKVAAAGCYENFRRTRIAVVATAELLGKPVEVRDGNTLLARGVVAAGRTRPCADLILPMPPLGKPYGPLAVRVDRQALPPIELPDPDTERRTKFAEAKMLLDPAVVAGDVFPRADFADPAMVENLVGPYSIAIDYYDADYNRAKAPTRAGRYGAVVRVTTEAGLSTTRQLTLFHQPKLIDWGRRPRLPFAVELPAEMGLEPSVVKEQSRQLDDLFTWQLPNMVRDPETAVLLAGLYETKPGIGPAIAGQTAASRNEAWWFGLNQKLGMPPLRYLAYTPEGYTQASDQKWPLLLFLHGAGERGDDLERVKTHGPPKLIAAGQQFPFIVISPQCPEGQWWSPYVLNHFLDEILTRYNVDTDGIYVTGLSMGGFGSWALATHFPQRFAAIVPICGGGSPDDVPAIKDLPVWCFHGARDNIVPIEEDAAMVDALRKIGGRVRFTIEPDAMHDAWTAAYNDPELYQWLLRQRRGQPAEPPASPSQP